MEATLGRLLIFGAGRMRSMREDGNVRIIEEYRRTNQISGHQQA